MHPGIRLIHMLLPMAGPHDLLVESAPELTRGACTCGRWRRDAGPDTVAVTGKSREETLRAAHDLHARGIVDT